MLRGIYCLHACRPVGAQNSHMSKASVPTQARKLWIQAFAIASYRVENKLTLKCVTHFRMSYHLVVV